MAEQTTTSRRRGSTAPAAPTRLPSTRERRPAMAALAVLLIIGGALASGWLALRSGHRADYLVVQTDVAQGQQIDQGDLDVVSLPDDLTEQYVVAGRLEEVVGKEATTPLRPGMVLTEDLFDEEVGPAEGESQQSLEIPESLIPTETTDGSTVLIFFSSGEADTSPATAVEAKVVRITLPESGEDGIGGGTASALAAVTVAIPTRCADELARASFTGEFTIQLYAPAAEEEEELALHACMTGPEPTATTGTD
jgi:hypothetical protein